MFFNIRQALKKSEKIEMGDDKPSVFDHEFYLKTYPDLVAENITTRSDAMLHYMTIGRKEGRYCSYTDMINKHVSNTGMNLINVFDHKFYLETYTDLGKHGITTQRDAIIHFIQCGMKEGRAYSPKNMRERYASNLQQARDALRAFPDTNPKQFRILIRTSNRAESFKRCIKSILDQTYTNYHVYVCYDSEESINYLNAYAGHHAITYFPIHIDSKEKYKFNLYCNVLMDKVNDGYILFLDDDDMLVDTRVLEVLNSQFGSNQIVTWRFLRPDKLIFPENLDKELVLGEIDTASVCFHYSLKHLSRWGDKQYGDYNFYRTLFNACPRNCISHIEYTLTMTQFYDKIGNYGKQF